MGKEKKLRLTPGNRGKGGEEGGITRPLRPRSTTDTKALRAGRAPPRAAPAAPRSRPFPHPDPCPYRGPARTHCGLVPRAEGPKAGPPPPAMPPPPSRAAAAAALAERRTGSRARTAAAGEKSPARGSSLPLLPLFKAAFRPLAGSSLPCFTILSKCVT